jgi:hypothetical protein
VMARINVSSWVGLNEPGHYHQPGAVGDCPVVFDEDVGALEVAHVGIGGQDDAASQHVPCSSACAQA